jgi:hypothetical protein
VAKTWDINAIAQRWAQRMGAADTVAKYKAGIASLTVSPTATAASPQSMQRYLDGVNQAVTSGKRAAALNAVSLSAFQQAATVKGAAHLGTGAQMGQAKYASGLGKYPAVWSQIQSQLAGMPKGGLANAMARSQVSIQALMAAAGRS